MFKLTRKTFYIILFSILWLITAFSSFFHAVEFFELSNVTWMGIILAMAFEIGQASVLMSILTSPQDRKKYTPWILMCILTLVQIIGNVYSSYKYIMLNSPENLKYFKEPIFIWTQLPDAEATVIITNIDNDTAEEDKDNSKEDTEKNNEDADIHQEEIQLDEKKFDEFNKDAENIIFKEKNEEIDKLKKEIEDLKQLKKENEQREEKSNSNDEQQSVEDNGDQGTAKSDIKEEVNETMSDSPEVDKDNEIRESHFINLK